MTVISSVSPCTRSGLAGVTATSKAGLRYSATLKLPKYRNMKLVKVAYGNDNPTDSAKETQALVQAYPNLKGIISPTTVGISSAAQVLDQAGKCKSVALTGLGLPNQMRKYVKKGCAKKFGLWNERDFGYLATYVASS